ELPGNLLHRRGTAMAKQCTVCHKSFPDDQTVCPHCGAEADTGADIDWSALEEGGSSVTGDLTSRESPSDVLVVQLGHPEDPASVLDVGPSTERVGPSSDIV